MKNILTKLNKIREVIDVEKEGSRYKAFTVAKLNAELNPLLIRHNLGVSFDILDQKVEPLDKGDGRFVFLVKGQICYRIHDLDSDEVLTFNTVFTGLNSEGDPSKSQGNAHSYSYKYFWVTLLGLTDEESDVDSPQNQLNEQLAISTGTPKDKSESKKIYESYVEGFESCTTRTQASDLIEDARQDYDKLLNYEQVKLKALIKQIKEQWQLGEQ
jgi:hypothetical protein